MKNKFFYGYVVAAACFVIMFMHVGGLGTFSVFMPAIEKDVGLSIGQLSLVITVTSACGFVFSLLAGKIMQAISPRWALALASLALAGNYLLYAISDGIALMYVGAALSGFAVACGSQAANAAVISEWFIEKRASILGLVFGSSALGSAILLFLSGMLIDHLGWRGAYWVLFFVILGITIPVNLLFLKNPEKKGLKPLGWENAAKAAASGSRAESMGVDAAFARKTRSFWFLFAAMMLVGTLVTGFKAFAPAFWQSSGMDPLDSSRYISIFMLISTAATMISGAIADKFGNKTYIIYLHMAFLAGMVLVIQSASNLSPVFLLPSILIMGISYPLSGAIPATVTTEAFGNKDYSKICALLMAGYYGGVALVPPIMGIAFEKTGSYVPAFTLLLLFAANGLLLILLGLKASPLKSSCIPAPTVAALAAEE